MDTTEAVCHIRARSHTNEGGLFCLFIDTLLITKRKAWVMNDKIQKLEDRVDLIVGGRRSELTEIVDEFKVIAMTLAAEVHGEKDMVKLKKLKQSIDKLSTLRKGNAYLEKHTKMSFINLIQSYHLSLYFNSLRVLLRENESPDFENVGQIMKDIDSLLDEAKKQISKFHYKMLKSKARDTKRLINSRLSKIDRLLKRFIQKKAEGLKRY